MTTSERTMADMEPDELVQAIEELDGMIRERNRHTDTLKAEKVQAEAYLLRRLEPGEAVQAPSGRIVYRDEGPQGNATVNKDALEELSALLPDEIQVGMTPEYPSVGAIRKVAKDGGLPSGVSLDDLLIAPPSGSKIRWRTITEDGR